jgi:membrane associated rhomboid family serine protease
MIPISDDNPARLTPILNYGLIAVCAFVFLWQLNAGEAGSERLIMAYGFTPASVFDAGMTETAASAGWVTVATSMFLHGGLLHLAGNLLYLWIFGNNIEDAMGHFRYLVFYIACGVGAALSEGAIYPSSSVPMIGASGAISGVLAAYLLIFPRARVTVIVPLGILLYPLKIAAIYVIGFWFIVQIFEAAMSPPGEPGVAWWAHIGGFVVGLALAPIFSNYPLFGHRQASPWR